MSTVQICPQTGRPCELTSCAGCLATRPPTFSYPPKQYGWICPRCNVVHAPHVQRITEEA